MVSTRRLAVTAAVGIGLIGCGGEEPPTGSCEEYFQVEMRAATVGVPGAYELVGTFDGSAFACSWVDTGAGDRQVSCDSEFVSVLLPFDRKSGGFGGHVWFDASPTTVALQIRRDGDRVAASVFEPDYTLHASLNADRPPCRTAWAALDGT